MNDQLASGEAPIDEIAAADRFSDTWPLLYLGFPILVYLVGWLRPVFGIPSALVLIIGLASLLRDRARAADGSQGVGAWRWSLPIIVIAASTWTFFGGLGHFVYANTDWVVRDALLVDLVGKSWPVHYEGDHGHALLLRAPLAFYLPAAVTGKWFGIRVAELTLFAWTSIGVTLTFWLMLRDRPRMREAVIRGLAFVLFSGMDIIGYCISMPMPSLGDHLEWWATLFQYSSQTTLLFWVPNHALPGWVAVAWLLGYRPRSLPIPVAIAMLACIPLWSPLTAIGLAPIFAIALLRQYRFLGRSEWLARCLDWRALAVVSIFAVFVGPYLLIGGGTIPSGFSWEGPSGGEVFVLKYVEFVVLEFGLVGAVLMCFTPRDPLLIGSIVVLLLLPIYHFGPANDFVMRAAIGPLAIVAIRLGEWFASPCIGRIDRKGRMAFGVLLAVGAITPLMEFARAFTEPRWPMDIHRTIIETHGNAPHYLTRADQPWPSRFLKQH